MVQMVKTFDVAERFFKGQHLKKAFYAVQKKENGIVWKIIWETGIFKYSAQNMVFVDIIWVMEVMFKVHKNIQLKQNI